ncbi:MAG: hypothetical protein MUP03_07665, partial [Anaerolineales bacterium]|nr:hypothetical protein [Anaerolineales bacterium]
MKIIKSFSVVAGFGLISGLLGYVRDAALAAKFGATLATDAFFAAFFVPNALFLILISGSIGMVFIPIFTEYLGKDRKEAWHVASSVFNLSMLVLGLIVLVGVVTVQSWLNLLFPGFGKGTMQLSVALSFCLLPVLLFTGLASLASAALNSFEHFTIPALGSIIGNIIVIPAIIFSGYFGGIYGVAIGVLIGMLIQLLIQIPVLLRFGLRYQFVINIRHPAILRMIKLALPLIAYLIIAYTSVAVERIIASSLSAGTVSALNYSMHIFILPVTIFAGSLGTVIYPRLSMQSASNDNQAFTEKLAKA